MIPNFEGSGNLPAGVHLATIDEVVKRFGYNSHRKDLLVGLKAALSALKKAGCKCVYLDGSFVTDKKFPNDYDACWDTNGVDPSALDMTFLDFANGRKSQKAKYKGEFFIGSTVASSIPRLTFLEFFQQDKNGDPKGIIQINL